MVHRSTIFGSRERNIAIMAAVAAIAAATAGITSGEADRDYSVAQDLLTQGGQDEQMLLLSMLAYDHGYIDTGNYLFTQVSNENPNMTYTKEDVIDQYILTVPDLYYAASFTFEEGDYYQGISDYFIASSAILSGVIVAYAEISKRKQAQNT